MGEMEDFEEARPEVAPRGIGALRRRGIYLLPNLFTTAALFFGFYAVVQAMNGRLVDSAIAIFVAMVLDGLDGRVARLTHTQSEFGAEYDSLSDMVSFGVAPALVMYEWVMKDLGKAGWIAAFVYCAGAALRLARFNTNIDVVDKRYFQGLPSPMAAAFIAGFVWVIHDLEVQTQAWIPWTAWTLRQRAVLQLQGHQPEEERAVLGDARAGGEPRRDLGEAGGGALHAVRRLRRVGLRPLGDGAAGTSRRSVVRPRSASGRLRSRRGLRRRATRGAAGSCGARRRPRTRPRSRAGR
jgi:CDP-diacylglycerol--serine O-phosphatidyltransferase